MQSQCILNDMRERLYHCWYWVVIAFCVFVHFFVALFSIFSPIFFKTHRKLARFFIMIIAKAMQLRVTTDGLNNIPKDRACIFMPNHTSAIDILVMIIGLPYHFNFIAKKELIWVPFIGLDMIMGGDFLIDRSNPRKAKKCLEKVQRRLQKGWNMLIFPEGTRSANGELLPFKRGAFKLAVDSGACIVPCYIDGSDKIVQKKSLKAAPGTVHIRFGTPIDAANYGKSKPEVIALMESAQNAVQTLSKTIH